MSVILDSVEGNRQWLDGGAMFGNVPRALWSRWVDADDRHRIPLACRALLARGLAGRTVLFETGIGAFFDPAMRDRFGVEETEHVLLKSLAELGLGDADIDVVVLSHLHFDHAGGLLSAWREGESPHLLFPNAQFLVGARHWQRACHPHPRDRASFLPDLNRQLADSGRLELVEGEFSETLGEAVRFTFSDGHTPGLMLAEIVGPGNRDGVVFCADLVPGTPWVHLPVTMGYDRYPECLIDEKSALLADVLERGIRLFFTHDPSCAMAAVDRDEKGRFRAVCAEPEVRGMALGDPA